MIKIVSHNVFVDNILSDNSSYCDRPTSHIKSLQRKVKLCDISPWNTCGRSSDPLLSPLHQQTVLFKILNCDKSLYDKLLSGLVSSVMDLQVWLQSLIIPTKCSNFIQRHLVEGPDMKSQVLSDVDVWIPFKPNDSFKYRTWDLKNDSLIRAMYLLPIHIQHYTIEINFFNQTVPLHTVCWCPIAPVTPENQLQSSGW